LLAARPAYARHRGFEGAPEFLIPNRHADGDIEIIRQLPSPTMMSTHEMLTSQCALELIRVKRLTRGRRSPAI